MAVNLSSSSDTNSNEQYKNRNSITNKTDECEFVLFIFTYFFLLFNLSILNIMQNFIICSVFG